MSIDDKPPAYSDTLDRKSPPIEIPNGDPTTHTIWLTFTGDSASSSPITILLAFSSTFLDFQSKIKHRYLETRSKLADRIAFIWSTFLVEASLSSISDSASTRDAADGVYLDEHNWETLKPTILTLPRPGTSAEKLQKKK